MRSFPRRAGIRSSFLLSSVLALLLSPMTLDLQQARAQDALYPGVVALVANSGGQPVLLRESPGYDGAVVSSFPEGTPADVVEGPLYDADGAAWLGVAIGGVSGYMQAGYLVDGGQASAPLVETPADVAPEELASDTAAAPPESSALPANPIATADLNLRAGPSYDEMVLQIIPSGSPLTPTGEYANGFAAVTVNGQYGWVDTAWLGDAGAPQAPVDGAVLLQEAAATDPTTAPVEDSALVADLNAPAGESAMAIDVANLRLGPSESDDILRVLPAGAMVTITGATADGWTPVWYNGTWGFVSADLLTNSGDVAADAVSLAQQAAPEAVDTASGLLATTLSDVNLRATPDMSSAVLGTIPSGVGLTPLSGPQSGFYQIAYDDQTGWVSADYLQVSAAYLQRGDRGKVEGSEPASNAEKGSGGIIWPVSGGAWEVMQGYNGSSHQNEDGLWQYYYSLDLQRVDGNTAGQTIYAPVNGIVRWTDPGSGGISIDIGGGHAVAMFHVTFDGHFQAGSEVSQGEPMGQISGAGGPGYAGTPHVHFTLWSSDDDGNWDRHAEPFTGKFAIAGMDFPDIGGSSQYAGTTFDP